MTALALGASPYTPPPLRRPDPSGVIGFEVQFAGGYIQPRFRIRDVAAFMMSTLDLTSHASENARKVSTELAQFPLFDVTAEAVTSHNVGRCRLSKHRTLPSALTCERMEIVSAPLPMHRAAEAADAVLDWAEGPWLALIKTIKGNSSTVEYDLDLNFTHGRILTDYPGATASLLDAVVLPQTTVAVPLARLRRWFNAALGMARQKGFNRGYPVKEHPRLLDRIGDFSAFMRRVDAACRADSMPEDYCGLLALSGHVARSFGQTYNSSKFRHELARSSVKNVFQHQLLPAAIPVLHRTNLASTYAYVAARVGREQPALSAQLADRFVEHMGAVLEGDLLLGASTPLLDMPVKSYEYSMPHNFMVLIEQLNHSVAKRGLHNAIEWLVASSHQGGAGLKMRERFTKHYEERSRKKGVVAFPIKATDWARAITHGVDRLSDHGTYGTTGQIVFKSLGAWEVGPCGMVHLENSKGPGFDRWVKVGTGISASSTLHRAMADYRKYAKLFAQIMAGDDDETSITSKETRACLREYREAASAAIGPLSRATRRSRTRR